MRRFSRFTTILVALVLGATAAYATHSWPDVPDNKFYAESVAWAKANGMTTGCEGGSNFCPDRGVTRGENITFAKRYDDLVVQPALQALEVEVKRLADLVESGPALGTPIANGCALEGRDDFGYWDLTLSFSNPTTETADAWIDTAIRDENGIRISTEFDIIDNVLPGESVSELIGTIFDGETAASCDILAIEWR